MSKNYAIIIHFMLPPTTFYRSGAHRSDVYKWDAFVTSWRFYNRAWQPQRHDRLPETSGTLWIHRGALTNQRCSLATGCGIKALSTAWCLLTTVSPSHWCISRWVDTGSQIIVGMGSANEMTLQCKIISHWQRPCPEWSLRFSLSSKALLLFCLLH